MKKIFVFIGLFLPLFVYGSGTKFKRIAIEPEIGFQFSKWSQNIDSTPLTGTMAGNSHGFRYGANLHYHLATRITAGYGYKIDQLTWMYSDSEDYNGDNDWPETSKATEKSHTAFMGIRFQRFILLFQYIFDSRLNFNDYFVENFGSVEYKGSGFGLKLQFPLSNRIFWGLTFRQLTYDKVKMSGESSGLPATISGVEFMEKKNQSVIIDLSFPIGIL